MLHRIGLWIIDLDDDKCILHQMIDDEKWDAKLNQTKGDILIAKSIFCN